MTAKRDQPWGEGEEPSGGDESGERAAERAIEQYGTTGAEVIVWDTVSNYSRVRQMRLEGQTVSQIAEALNIKPSTVKQALTNHLKADSARIDADEQASILSMELDRLDHMLQSYWFAAKAGDLDAAKLVLSIGKERREWLKWVQPEPTGAEITNNILVVGGSEAEFLAGLEQARIHIEGETMRQDQEQGPEQGENDG